MVLIRCVFVYTQSKILFLLLKRRFLCRFPFLEDLSMMQSQLFEFAFFPFFDNAISNLAGMAIQEPWSFSNERPNSFSILKNYLEHIFRRIKYENKILYSTNNLLACFNTGLMTPSYQYIFAFFEKNRNPNAQNQYYFKKFISESDIGILSNFEKPPQAAYFFQDPSLLIYDPALSILKDIDHIVDDNIERFPIGIKNDKNMCRLLLDGAIPQTEKRLRANYKIAVPQWYNNRVQLLLPIYLSGNAGNPDIALAIEKNRDKYCAITCLTMRMAYQNARIIVKPESSWLHP